MCEPGEALYAAARGLIGVPFRLHGRSRETGVDCVGLALLSARAAGLELPEVPAYRLRTAVTAQVDRWMANAGFRLVEGARPGDILVVRINALQAHLLVQGYGDVIHAHAGLGRVVEMPLPDAWPLLSRWRATVRIQE